MLCLNRPKGRTAHAVAHAAARAAVCAALLAGLAACGGKPEESAVAAPQGAASGASQVTGIGTASSVSVVTAKNAQ